MKTKWKRMENKNMTRQFNRKYCNMYSLMEAIWEVTFTISIGGTVPFSLFPILCVSTARDWVSVDTVKRSRSQAWIVDLMWYKTIYSRINSNFDRKMNTYIQTIWKIYIGQFNTKHRTQNVKQNQPNASLLIAHVV